MLTESGSESEMELDVSQSGINGVGAEVSSYSNDMHPCPVKKDRGAPTPKREQLKSTEKKPKAAPKKDLFGLIEEISPQAFHLSDHNQKIEAKAFYKKHGYAIVMPFSTDAERDVFCEECVKEVWNNIVNSAGYKKEIRDQMPMIETQQDLADFMGQLPPHIRKNLKTLLGDHLFFHYGFGASCYNSSFHSKSAWKMRMNFLVASFAKMLMKDGEEAYFSIDRTISKWLGKGDEEFVHVDTAMGADKDDGTVNGKFCAVAGKFICTPGSHLLTEEVAELYPPIYKTRNKNSAKFALDPDNEDPLGLFNGSKKIVVPAGCLILWHNNLFHGVSKNLSGAVQWGFYIGFTNNIFRTGTEYHKSGTSQIQDRYDSWRNGVRPLAHPSCDPTHLYPKKFLNMHGILGKFIENKMDTSNPQYDFSQRMTAGSKMVPHLVENPDPDYKPYALSVQGRALLVGEKNVGGFEWDFPMAQ